MMWRKHVRTYSCRNCDRKIHVESRGFLRPKWVTNLCVWDGTRWHQAPAGIDFEEAKRWMAPFMGHVHD